MSEHKKNFEKNVILACGKILSILVSFLIPFYLGRALSIESYGTYKQLMLLFWFGMIIFNMGMDASLFYFLKKDEKSLPIVSLNIFLINFLITICISALLIGFKTDIAGWLKNQELIHYLPPFCLMTLFSVSSQHFEDIFIGIDKLKYKILIDILTEFFKTIAILGGYYFFHSLWVVLLGLTTVYAVKSFVLVWFDMSLIRKSGIQYSLFNPLIREQIKYAIPIGFANLIAFIMDLEKMIISALFGIYAFTIYTVGCFDVPLIPAIRNNMLMLMNVDMLEAKKSNHMHKIQYLWQTVSRKFFLIQIPVSIYMVFFAKEIITFIFSEKYAESSVYFQVFSVLMAINALAPDTVFYVMNRTKLHFKIQFFALFYRLGLIIIFAKFGGPLWALIGKGIGNLILSFSKLASIKKLIHLKWTGIFLWKQLAGISLASALCIVPVKLLFDHSGLSNFFVLSLSFPLYTFLVMLISIFFKIIKADERKYLKDFLFKMFGKAKTGFNFSKTRETRSL